MLPGVLLILGRIKISYFVASPSVFRFKWGLCFFVLTQQNTNASIFGILFLSWKNKGLFKASVSKCKVYILINFFKMRYIACGVDLLGRRCGFLLGSTIWVIFPG